MRYLAVLMQIPVTRQVILKNTFYLTISQIANRILEFVLALVLIRYLGPENYGSLILSLAFLGLFSVFVDAGMEVTIIREASRNPNDLGKLIGNGVTIRCIFALGGFALATTILSFLDYAQETTQLFRLAILFLFLSPFSHFRVILLITQNIKLAAALDILSQLIKTACILGVVLLMGKVEQILLAQLFAIILTNIIYINYGLKVSPQPISFRIDRQLWSSLLKYSWPILATGVFYTFQLHIGRLIIGFLLGNMEIGIYSVAFSLSTVLSFLPSVYFASVYPIMSRYFAKDKIKFRWLYRFSFRIMIIVSLPISLLTSLTSKEIVALFAGDEYLPAASLLIVLIWGQVFLFSGSVLYHIILSTAQQYILVPIAFLRMVSYLSLLFICISMFGLFGSSIALLVIYVFLFIIYGIVKATRLYIFDWLREMIIPAMATLISFAILNFFHPPTILIWPIGFIVYIASLSLLGLVTQPEKRGLLITHSMQK